MKSMFTFEISSESALSLGKEGKTALIYPGNPSGDGNGGIAPVIKKAAGEQLVGAIRSTINARISEEKPYVISHKKLYLPVTESVIVGACNLSSQGFSHIIYCAGPDYREKANDKKHAYTHHYKDKVFSKKHLSAQEVLTATYENALRVGLEEGVTHFVFPQVSAGVFAGREEARIHRLTAQAIKTASENILNDANINKDFSITLSCFNLNKAKAQEDFRDLNDCAEFHGLVKEKEEGTAQDLYTEFCELIDEKKEEEKANANASTKTSYRDTLARERETKKPFGFSRA